MMAFITIAQVLLFYISKLSPRVNYNAIFLSTTFVAFKFQQK